MCLHVTHLDAALHLRRIWCFLFSRNLPMISVKDREANMNLMNRINKKPPTKGNKNLIQSSQNALLQHVFLGGGSSAQEGDSQPLGSSLQGFFLPQKAPTLIWAKAKGTTAITTGFLLDISHWSCASPQSLVE